MNINLICVGSIKEKFYEDAIKEYVKRLSRYIKLDIIVLKDEKTPANAYVVALDLQGKKYTSEKFATYISGLETFSRGNLTFIIGGSLGLSKIVLDRANAALCFSDMTFPHQLMRVIFLEQLYRAYRIINNEPYHK